MTVTFERVPYGGWPECGRLSNSIVDMIVPLAVGPRILRFGFAGGENVLKEFPEQLGQTGGDQFRMYGGHRLWHAPEARPRTYFPDNQPVTCKPLDGGVRLVPPVETITGIQKELEIQMAPDAARVTVIHRLTNTGLWATRLAPWALTIMAPGGTAILPLPPKGEHATRLLPAAALVLWAYTDMSDPRWTWGSRYVLLRQDPARAAPQKAGLSESGGWLAYARAGLMLVKRFTPVAGAEYPDLGASVEVFTDAVMLELETLGPLVDLAPGVTVTHTEEWSLFTDVPPVEDEHQASEMVRRYLKL